MEELSLTCGEIRSVRPAEILGGALDGCPCVEIVVGSEEEGASVTMLVDLAKARRLVVGLLSALASHNDKRAIEICETYFPE